MPQAHRPILFRRPPLLGPGWNPGRASRASKVAGAFLVLFWRAKENISSATLCFVKVIIVERCASGTNPFRHFALRNATSPEGGGLGKEGKFRPRRSTAGRSQPLSGKLFAPAKASPFRERWHGKAVMERVAFGKNPLSRLRRQLVPLFVAYRRHLPPAGGSLSKGEPLAKRAGLVLIRQRQEEASVKLQTLLLCQSLSLSGEVARRSRDGEGRPPTAKKPACPLPFYGAGKLAFVFLFRGRAYSSILPKPRPSKSSTRSVRLGATGSALAASRGA